MTIKLIGSVSATYLHFVHLKMLLITRDEEKCWDMRCVYFHALSEGVQADSLINDTKKDPVWADRRQLCGFHTGSLRYVQKMQQNVIFQEFCNPRKLNQDNVHSHQGSLTVIFFIKGRVRTSHSLLPTFISMELMKRTLQSLNEFSFWDFGILIQLWSFKSFL